MKMKFRWKPLLFVVILLFMLGFAITQPDFSVETILDFVPQDPMKAAVVLLLLYILKGVIFVIPVIVLQVAAGFLFPTHIALLVNSFGLLILLTIPYQLGRTCGKQTIERVILKYPRVLRLLDMQQSNSFFLCFFLRLLCGLPMDVITMYLGATKTSFRQNMIGGFLGLLPGMILATLMGNSVQDPTSPMFWIAAGLMGILILVSGAGYKLYLDRMGRKEVSNDGRN